MDGRTVLPYSARESFWIATSNPRHIRYAYRRGWVCSAMGLVSGSGSWSGPVLSCPVWVLLVAVTDMVDGMKEGQGDVEAVSEIRVVVGGGMSWTPPSHGPFCSVEATKRIDVGRP